MDNIIGHKVVQIRKMTQAEQDKEGWNSSTIVIVLSNGVRLYASSDEEGNDAGAMFGRGKLGNTFILQ